MIKRLIGIVATVLALTGCAVSPQHVQNTAVGAGLGAIAGAIIGDNSDSAKRGAVLGGLIGAILPVHQPAQAAYPYGYPQGYPQGGLPPGMSCPAGSAWDGRGCRVHQSYQPYNPYQINPQVYGQQPGVIPPGAVCGAAALHMSCPSIVIPGTNCRRCQ